MHPAALPLDELARDCQIERTRRRGPGGQHRNKVETAVVITHKPTALQGSASERRSQAENLAVAWQRLRVNLAIGVRGMTPPESPPSAVWQQRVRGAKIAVNLEHADFPLLLAEALDRLAARDWNVTVTADDLRITSSQLIKFLQREPRAMGQLNQIRRQRGLPEYR
jgi:hypothetical protein